MNRAERRSRTLKQAIRQQKLAKLYSHSKVSLGYFKKKHALDCGNPQCSVCRSPNKGKGREKMRTVKDVFAEMLPHEEKLKALKQEIKDIRENCEHEWESDSGIYWDGFYCPKCGSSK